MKKLPFVSALVLAGLGSVAASAQTSLVISQVYGGGGNSGATYKNDFVELYNPTAAPISVNGWSVQYASSSGSGWSSTLTKLPDATVQPGHYFLVQESQGAGGTTNLPAPDAAGTIAMASGSGKVALVSSINALSGTCPTGGTVVDFIGYGSVNCPVSDPAPALTNTTADIRKAGSYTGDNLTDFASGPPTPRDSCYPGVCLTAIGTATPSEVNSGSTVLLTVAVTAPNGTAGVTVTADLSAIGGSSAQPFYDDGTNGDEDAGDGVYSFSTTATVATTTTISIPATVTDAQSDQGSTNISLKVDVPPPVIAIHTIQGSKSLTATSVSPYAGQLVTTTGVVIGIGSAGYFIEAPDSDQDSDPTTPEGVYVYTGSGKVPTGLVVGNEVQVTGTVQTYPAVSASHTPATEIDSASATINGTASLPTPITIDATKLSPTGGLYQLTPYEGMRVRFDSLTSVSGTDGYLTENTETIESNGQFYAVITGTPRPFREPGVDIRDPQAGLPPNVAFFDDNPERLIVFSDFLLDGSGQYSAPIDLSTGAVLPNVTGILDFTYSSDSYYDPARLLIEPGYNTAAITPGMSVQPVPAPAANEFTVAAYNIERFFNTDSSDDIDYYPVTGKTEKSEAVDVTPAAYARRLKKVSLAIRHVLGSPDIVALEEAENVSVVSDIAAQISADAQAAGEPDPQYVAYGTGTDYAPYTDDEGGISVGFLVKASTVNTLSITQQGWNSLYTDPNTGKVQSLNDRPPLVLHVGVKRANATDYPVTVIVNHLRSLSGENDPSTGVTVQIKKEYQAEFLAGLIQQAQTAGEHVISVGDYNAFEFSDGYIDILGTVTNKNVLPADEVKTPGVAGLVVPPATDLALTLPADQRWSYQEYGNAQILDHIVVTQDLLSNGAHLAYAHLDADQPLIAYNDDSTPARTSDHDAAVGYFTLPAPVLSATLTGTGAFGSISVGSTSSGQGFVLTNTGEGQLTITGIAASGDFAETNTCGSTLALGESCTINVVFAPKFGGARTGTLTVTTNAASAYTAPLTGTGAYDAAVVLKAASTQLTYPGATNLTACLANAPGNTANGSMRIYDGETLLTTQPVQGGGCAYWYISPALTAGTHQLTAYYTGDATHVAGLSTPVSVTVKPVTVNLSAACWLANGSYSCAVTASSNAGGAPGVITYTLDGGAAVSVPLSYGNAQLTIAQPPAGTHTVVITYPQQGNFAEATTGVKSFTVASH